MGKALGELNINTQNDLTTFANIEKLLDKSWKHK